MTLPPVQLYQSTTRGTTVTSSVQLYLLIYGDTVVNFKRDPVSLEPLTKNDGKNDGSSPKSSTLDDLIKFTRKLKKKEESNYAFHKGMSNTRLVIFVQRKSAEHSYLNLKTYNCRTITCSN